MYSWRRSTVTDGCVKTTPQKTRFRRVKYARIWETDWVDGHSDKTEIYSKRLNAKEVIFPKENGEFIFQSKMDESKPWEEIETWEHPPWYGSDQFEEKVTLIFLENQKGLFHHLTTRFWMPVKQLVISGPCEEISFSAITHTNLDVKQESRIDDYWNIGGSRDLSDPWTGFTQFTLLEEKPPNGYMWSGRRLTRKQLTSRPDYYSRQKDYIT